MINSLSLTLVLFLVPNLQQTRVKTRDSDTGSVKVAPSPTKKGPRATTIGRSTWRRLSKFIEVQSSRVSWWKSQTARLILPTSSPMRLKLITLSADASSSHFDLQPTNALATEIHCADDCDHCLHGNVGSVVLG